MCIKTIYSQYKIISNFMKKKYGVHLVKRFPTYDKTAADDFKKV